MKIRPAALILVIVAGGLVAGFGIWFFPGIRNNDRGEEEILTIGVVPSAAAALIYVAEAEDFFEENDLHINITDYPTGIATTGALLREETELSWAAEFPFVRRAFAQENIAIIAVVDRFNEQHLFGRKDRGIRGRADFDGKTIGIPQNTIAEFYIGRYFQFHGIETRNITFVNVGATESVDAIAGGKIDGVVAWEPYSSMIKVQMGDRVVALPIQNNQPGYGTIVGRKDWLQRQPGIVHRFLAALKQAETYCTHNPAGAKAIVRKRLAFDEAFTEMIWSENQFSLSLDQSLVLAMEDEARWMIRNNLTNATTVPDFRDYVFTDALEAVKPGSVNIIR